MPSAEIITIGTEILLGEIVDTNTRHIARTLRAMGVDLFRTITIGDNVERIADAINTFRNTNPLTFFWSASVTGNRLTLTTSRGTANTVPTTFTSLPAEEAEQFRNMAAESRYKALEAEIGPERTGQIRDLLTRR